MFLKPYGYTNHVVWWDICISMYDESAPTDGEHWEVGYKWAINESVLFENDCSYSSRKDGHLEDIRPYQFHQAPTGVTWENERSLGEWWRQVKLISPEWLQDLLSPMRSVSRWSWRTQRSIDCFLDKHWWQMPTYPRRWEW